MTQKFQPSQAQLKRLYYDDAYTTEFSASVLHIGELENGLIPLVLDQTYFYPTSGGQPFDLGMIGESAVSNITVRKTDETILHWVASAAGLTVGQPVNCTIDWQRRFDHMQQHSSQHILSQAFIQVADAHTVGFHLTDDNLTIDVDKTGLSESDITKAEALANEVVFANRPIACFTIPLDEANSLNLRKIPPVKGNTLRIVDIDGFDTTACGGTHVAHTGELGLIKVIKVEKQKKKSRITFASGNRALQDYGQKNTTIQTLTGKLTVSQADLPTSVDNLQSQIKSLRKSLKGFQQKQLEADANSLLASGERVITAVFDDYDMGQLRILANKITADSDNIALLASSANGGALCFVAGDGATANMNQCLQSVLPDGFRGGGNDKFGQAVGKEGLSAVSNTQLQQILAQVKNTL